MVSPKDVVDFWCGECEPSDWYKQENSFDDMIRERFGAAVETAQTGGFADWEDSAEGSLALLLLIDQFSRNIFRGSGQSFAGDARARDIARSAIARDFDQTYPMPERQFFIMPLMHSEDISDQDDCLRLTPERLGDEAAPTLLHARAHREVIRRFGRFPYRNAALGRETTPEEQAFLDGGSYGSVVRELEASG